MSGVRLWFWMMIVIGVVGILISAISLGTIAEKRYIIAGQNLAQGHGLVVPGTLEWAENGTTQPFTHGPPLLALWFTLTNILPVQLSIKILNVISLCGTSWFTYALMRRLTIQKDLAALAGIFVLCMPPINLAYLSLSTEAPFITLVILQFYVALLYYERDTSLIWLGMVGALSAFTRYSGVPLVVACSIMTFRTRSLKDSFIYSVISAVPLVIFIGLNYLTSGDVGNRELIYHPMEGGEVQALLQIVLLNLFMVVILLYLSQDRLVRWFIQFAGIFTVMYTVFIGLTATYFDALTPVDGRILAPLYVTFPLLIILSIDTIKKLNIARANRIINVMVGVFILFFTMVYGLTVFSEVVGGWNNPRNLDHKSDWGLPLDIVIYTDQPENVYFTFEQEAYAIPLTYSPFTDKDNPQLEDDIAEMREDLQQCVAVFISYGTRRDYLINTDELLDMLEMSLAAQNIDKGGTLYFNGDCGFSFDT